jgi:hypothetical protein
MVLASKPDLLDGRDVNVALSISGERKTTIVFFVILSHEGVPWAGSSWLLHIGGVVMGWFWVADVLGSACYGKVSPSSPFLFFCYFLF